MSFIPVEGLAPAELAVAWWAEDHRDDVKAFVAAVCGVAGHTDRVPAAELG